MDLRNLLVQPNKKNQRRKFKSVATSAVFHLVAVGLILLSSMSAARQVDAEDKPITAYLASAPPPPPPPPPPPAAKTASTPQQPRVTPVTPVEVPQPTFVQPREIPKELPKVDLTAMQRIPVSEPSVSLPDVPVGAGVEGGVPGGVVGGVEGGVMGGVIGGEIGGVEGGVVGGVVGGTVGGVEGGTGTELTPAPTPPPAPAGPLRVGGAVKAPTILSRPDPVYTEVARKARVTGVVVVEATIDKSGNVDRVRVIRGLPMGLSESAVNAVKRWKFKPGHMNGQAVDVLFNLTVNFQLGADSPKITQSKPVRSAPASVPEPSAPEPSAAEPAREPQAPADSPDTGSVGGDGSA